jgi:hypothetical protein
MVCGILNCNRLKIGKPYGVCQHETGGGARLRLNVCVVASSNLKSAGLPGAQADAQKRGLVRQKYGVRSGTQRHAAREPAKAVDLIDVPPLHRKDGSRCSGRASIVENA